MRFGLAVATVLSLVTTAWAHHPISPATQAAGWVVLFDGHHTKAWRGYGESTFPANWSVDGEVLKTTGEGVDLVTRDTFADFELELEWKSPAKGNSGIMYRVTEDHEQSWQTGPEYQILDDDAWGAAATDKGSAGAMYDLVEPRAGKQLKPAGEWNHARIRVNDGVAQHWVNGVKVVECRIDDDAWRERIQASKFATFKGFGIQPEGHIALQSHGNPMEFRNIHIRNLDTPMPGEVALFDGKTLTGWTFIADGSPAEAAWSVKDGVLITDGEPVGFLRTNDDYTNYVLKLEWRFSPVTKQAGNSGVLLRVLEDKVWPKSLEAQLLSENAGDILTIGDFPLKADASRSNGRHTKHATMAENAVGAWNEYEIICDGEHFTLIINGEVVNVASGAEIVAGKIAVQSEGAEIHFRNIRLAPIQ